MRGGCCSYAGSAIAYDYDIAFAVDWQVEHSGGGYLVMGGFDARKPTGESYHCFGSSVAVAINAHEAAERSVMRHEIVGDRADHGGRTPSELEIERVLKPHDFGRAVGIGLVAHAMIRDETNDRAELRTAYPCRGSIGPPPVLRGRI